jgi:hypothetical protein
MEKIEHKQTTTEAAGHIAGLGIGAVSAACRGKHISAAIIVLAGAILLIGGSLIAQVVGIVLVVAGFVGWCFSSPK